MGTSGIFDKDPQPPLTLPGAVRAPGGTWTSSHPRRSPAHPPAVDADGDAVIWLVAANLSDELQDGVDGRGDVMVRPVFIVELVDSAGFLQEKRSGRSQAVLCHPGDIAAAPVGTPAQQGEAGVLQTPPRPLCIRRQRLEVQFAAVLATKEAIPFYGILGVTCWLHPGSNLPQPKNSFRN